MEVKFRFFLISICFVLFNALFSARTMAQRTADSSRLRDHVQWLTHTSTARSYNNPRVLDSVANQIHTIFALYSDSVRMQEFRVKGKTYQNVIASFGTQFGERIIVGAHYDVCGDQPGADDNASGVAGLLELARLLSGQELKRRIDLVAFSLEEPPYFRSPSMGSYIHAKSLFDDNISVKGMISLEMIGYFSQERRTQDYPIGILKWFYGSRGNYITVVRKFGGGKFSRRFTRSFRDAQLPVKSFKGPRFLPGIDFSDHLNYWNQGFSAVMITDTSFYRNKNYHTRGDTIDTLNFALMTKVIDGVYNSLLKM
jgi:Zn-dependent M28 family amino/carboxypeptidase